MTTFTVTFKKDVTKDVVLKSLSNRLSNLPTTEPLSKFCGSITYLSLFLLPEFELEDKKMYSVETICTHVPGIFTLFMHDILEALAVIGCSLEPNQALYKILNSAGFYECFEMLGLVPRDWYRIFLFHYLGREVSYEQLLSLQTYDSLVQLFNTKIGESYE